MRNLSLVLAALVLLPGLARGQDKAGTTAATFLGIGADARGVAMGNAQVALSDGPSALYWNPSGIVEGPTALAFSTTSWLVDSRLSYVAAVVEAGAMGHFGLSVLAMDFGQMEVTNEDNPDGTGEVFTPLSFAAGVTYAKALTDRFAIGGTLKLVQERIWNETASAAALDLGVRYTTPFRGLRIGMTLTNFGSNLKLDGKDLYAPIDRKPGQSGDNPNLPGRLETDSWALPLAFRVGIAMNALESASQRLTVSADANAPSDNAQSASFGGEYSFRELFFVRGGYRQAFAADLDDQGWTLGFGLRYDVGALNLHADYSFREQQPFGTPQTLSVGVAF